ncbi:MAG: hypothetical protein IIU14_03210 [Ruminococcus sp.]|nr:hypothetical protein [Ruminococcus sp.]
MPTEIIVALIGLGGSAVGSLIGIMANSRLMNYRIKQLEDKVGKHNNLIERTYILEKRMELFNEKIKTANHRIDDLERKEEK